MNDKHKTVVGDCQFCLIAPLMSASYQPSLPQDFLAVAQRLSVALMESGMCGTN